MSKAAPAQKPVRIGIVEDDRLTRSLIADMISREPGFVLAGQWNNAEEFYETGPQAEMDLLLVDLDLPGDKGSNLIFKTKTLKPDLMCLVLTASRDPGDVFESVRLGASGYLVKDCSPRELLDGIRQAAHEGVSLSPPIARFLVEEFRNMTATTQFSPSLEVLTTRELHVLQRLAAGIATKDLATEVGLSYETIRTHLKKIYQKLHVNSREQAVALFAMKNSAS